MQVETNDVNGYIILIEPGTGFDSKVILVEALLDLLHVDKTKPTFVLPNEDRSGIVIVQQEEEWDHRDSVCDDPELFTEDVPIWCIHATALARLPLANVDL